VADEIIRIQLRLNPSQNYLDALIYSVLRRSPLNRSAYLRALLLKHLMEEHGGLGLSPEDQAYIASICPGAANTEGTDEGEPGEHVKPSEPSPAGNQNRRRKPPRSLLQPKKNPSGTHLPRKNKRRGHRRISGQPPTCRPVWICRILTPEI
jgi:hypothetical protein